MRALPVHPSIRVKNSADRQLAEHLEHCYSPARSITEQAWALPVLQHGALALGLHRPAGACPSQSHLLLNDEIRYRILRELERDPRVSQRDLADALGVSVGKANYCLRALIDKGLVKVNNFRKSGNKLAYAYQLTPKGLADKAKVTRRFLQLKQKEYDALTAEIAELRDEVSQSAQHDSAEPIES